MIVALFLTLLCAAHLYISNIYLHVIIVHHLCIKFLYIYIYIR